MIIKNSKPICVWKNKSVLGEGTLWVPTLNSIFFVDIKKKKIFILNTKSKKRKVLKVNKEIGFVSHIKRNIFALGLRSELRIVNFLSKKILYSTKIESAEQNNRLNDGKTDPMGRLWFGTMDNLERKKSSGSLYCLDKNLKLHKIDRKYFITNGPAFLDKNNFYHTDSRKRIIYKIKISNKLKILKKNIFLKFNKTDGSPDGMTTDVKNNLWVCHYGGGCISVYNLKATKIHKINLPVKNITNCTFGGFKNNELYISTARKGLKVNELIKYPLSGSLFKTSVNIKGKRTMPFKLASVIF
ncbi:MAG TPA: SMP-30/gluconolactonase/LRE family protein [Pelagibacteraceae bacterium]|nr:SMP-30/gluconolactonase/LRE family protein [Pelagibacteraceae bacterium]